MFRPRRRAFLGRPKALLSPGTWAFGFAGVAFGAAINAYWPPAPATTMAATEAVAVLAAPPPAEPAPAAAKTTASAVAILPVNASARIEPAPASPDEPNAGAPPPLAREEGVHRGAVTRVVDGDTFYLDGVKMRIRLWGVDAPERNAPGAAEATEALTNLVAGRALACEEMARDRHARIVARCLLDDGRDIARILIDIGAATEMPRYSGGYYGG